MHKRALQCLKRTFMHVSGLLPPYFDLKNQILYKLFFFIKIWWGKTLDMHKRAFQGLKRTFMHVSGLPHHILIKNQILIKYLVFYQKVVGEDLRHA